MLVWMTNNCMTHMSIPWPSRCAYNMMWTLRTSVTEIIEWLLMSVNTRPWLSVGQTISSRFSWRTQLIYSGWLRTINSVLLTTFPQFARMINNQFNVMIRFRKLIAISNMMRLYVAFILAHFHYCSSVWHFCTSRNSDKLGALNKRILRFILRDIVLPDSQLLEKGGTILLFDKRIQNMLTTLIKCFHFGNYPVYLKRLFTLRAVNYFWGTNILSLPKPFTTTKSLLSFRYYNAKLWSSLPDNTRTSISLTAT